MFEYKVRCKHKLGWKEIKLYADTDIEEFFNRNSIDYVRNITHTIENRQLKEIERLHSIIKEVHLFVEKYNDKPFDIEVREMILEILDKENI